MSPHFQNSDFITQNELPRLLRHADAGELQLYWVLVADCLLADTLSSYHAVNESKKPLVAMTEAEVNTVLAKMARTLQTHVITTRDRIRFGAEEQKRRETEARQRREAEERARIAAEEEARKKEEAARARAEIASISQKNPLTNSLGMKFVPVPGLINRIGITRSSMSPGRRPPPFASGSAGRKGAPCACRPIMNGLWRWGLAILRIPGFFPK